MNNIKVIDADVFENSNNDLIGNSIDNLKEAMGVPKTPHKVSIKGKQVTPVTGKMRLDAEILKNGEAIAYDINTNRKVTVIKDKFGKLKIK